MTGPGPTGGQMPEQPPAGGMGAAPPPPPPLMGSPPPAPPAGGSPAGAQLSSAQLRAIWGGFSGSEKLVAYGSGLVILAWIIGLAVSRGYLGGTGIIALLGGIAALVVMYLRHSPTMKITWPAPYELILLVISGIVGLLALLELLQDLSVLSVILQVVPLAFVAIVGFVIGAALMVWGAWQLYQPSMRKPT